MVEKKLKILIVEDSKTFAEYILSVLGISNYKITIAFTGKAGMEYLKKSSFNLILLDMQLPDISGLDILRMIREKYNQNQLPVIFISATTNEQLIIQALEAGANDFIQKPIAEIQLKLKIKNLIQLQQTNQQLIATHKKLKDRETNYRLIFENSPVGILSFDKKGVITACNERFAQIIGNKKEKLIGLNMLSLPDKKLAAALQKTINGSTAYYEGNYHSASVKKITPVIVFFKPLIADNGEIEGGVGIVEDVTEQKLAEEIIENKRLLLRTLIDNIPDSIYSKDLDCRKNLANLADIHNMGVQTESEILGKNDFDVYPKEIAEKFYADDQMVIQTGIPLLNRELLMVNGRGEKKWHLTSKVPLRGQNGTIIGLVGITRDITVVKQALEDLEKSELKISKMIANIGDVIVIIDKDGINKYKSSNLEKCFGWKPEELIGKSTWENVHPDDLTATQNFIGKLIAKANATGTTQCRYKRKDESYVWIEITIVNLLHDPDIKGFLGNYHDITDHKRADAEIELKNEQLIAANSDKDRFMQIIAHDLKSPFMTILGFLGLLTKNIRKYPIEKIEDQLAFITHATQNTFNLLEDLLVWIRAHSGKMTFNPKPLNLNTICNNVIEILNENAMAKNIAINQKISENITLVGDADMLKTVLRNLIMNAIKFTHRDGIITVNAEQNLSNIIISVTDNGVGMSQNDISKLFNISKTRSTSGTANERGTGLGLLLCKEFIEKHGGTIWVESELDKGSIFKFTLPAEKIISN